MSVATGLYNGLGHRSPTLPAGKNFWLEHCIGELKFNSFPLGVHMLSIVGDKEDKELNTSKYGTCS